MDIVQFPPFRCVVRQTIVILLAATALYKYLRSGDSATDKLVVELWIGVLLFWLIWSAVPLYRRVSSDMDVLSAYKQRHDLSEQLRSQLGMRLFSSSSDSMRSPSDSYADVAYAVVKCTLPSVWFACMMCSVAFHPNKFYVAAGVLLAYGVGVLYGVFSPTLFAVRSPSSWSTAPMTRAHDRASTAQNLDGGNNYWPRRWQGRPVQARSLRGSVR
jgi:hypothetical protein